jgi:hypothetical protein
MAQAAATHSRFHNLTEAALADAIGRANALVKGAEAELDALKTELRDRGLQTIAGEHFTVTRSDQFNTRLDVSAVKQHLGDSWKNFATTSVVTTIRIKAVELLAAAWHWHVGSPRYRESICRTAITVKHTARNCFPIGVGFRSLVFNPPATNAVALLIHFNLEESHDHIQSLSSFTRHRSRQSASARCAGCRFGVGPTRSDLPGDRPLEGGP